MTLSNLVNTLEPWVYALGITLLSFTILYMLKRLLIRYFRTLAKRTKTDIDDMLVDLTDRTRFFFILAVSILIGSTIAPLEPTASRMLRSVAVLVALIQAGIWGNGLFSFLIGRTVKKRMAEDAASATTISAMGFIGKLILWSVVFLLAADNLGFNITTLVTGLGIGGIAIALAVQNVLGDLLASLSIVLDRPFAIGDFIVVDQYLGTVEHVGLKTTRINSLSGEQLIFSNSDLLGSRIRNYKQMYQRRIVFSLGVTYQTPYEKLAGIGSMIREIIESHDDTRFDRAHFKSYGDSSLDFEIVYYVTKPQYNVYMDRQQSINLEIFRRFEQDGIEFAYPTRTLFVYQESNAAGPANQALQQK